jgi:hypothetical protein
MEEQTNNQTNQPPSNTDTYRESIDTTGVKPRQEIHLADLPPIPNIETPVKNLRTFESDIAEQVEQGTSLSKMVLAEAEKKAMPEPIEHQPMDPSRKKTLRIIAGMASIGILSLVAIIGVKHFAPGAATNTTTTNNAFLPPVQSLIFLNEAKEVLVRPLDRNTFISALTAEKAGYSGTLGAIRGLYPMTEATSSKIYLTGPQLVQLLSPSVPDSLVRVLDPDYALGLHAFDGNQFFLILKDNFYESAYAGMLAWENNLQTEFDPLFHRKKIVAAIQDDAATSTASSTDNNPSTTQDTLSSFDTQPTFTDMVIKNRDVRAVLDNRGQIVFLYTFADKNTIIITNNENTLKEVLDRLENAGIAR